MAKQKDHIIRCITTDGTLIAMAADTANTVYTAQQIHECSAVAAAALGRMLTASVMMGNMLKGDGASLTLRVNGGGPIGAVVAVADNAGHCRGYAENAAVELPLNSVGKLDVGGAVGRDGQLNVMKDLGGGQIYNGQVNLVSGEIAEDITEYYARSEQTPTVCALGVLTDKQDHSVLLAGGLIVQLLPTADEEAIDQLEKNLAELEPMTTMLAKGMTMEEICRKALTGFSVEVLDETPVEYACTCSRDRVKAAVALLSPEEIRSLADETGFAEANCHFCNKSYRISREELEALARARENKN